MNIPKIGEADAVASSLNMAIGGIQSNTRQPGSGMRMMRTTRGTIETPIARFQPTNASTSTTIVNGGSTSVCRWAG